jgi:hypothetical protein
VAGLHGTWLTGALGAAFFAVALVFVWRSFYGMRIGNIGSTSLSAPAAKPVEKHAAKASTPVEKADEKDEKAEKDETKDETKDDDK